MRDREIVVCCVMIYDAFSHRYTPMSCLPRTMDPGRLTGESCILCRLLPLTIALDILITLLLRKFRIVDIPGAYTGHLSMSRKRDYTSEDPGLIVVVTAAARRGVEPQRRREMRKAGLRREFRVFEAAVRVVGHHDSLVSRLLFSLSFSVLSFFLM